MIELVSDHGEFGRVQSALWLHHRTQYADGQPVEFHRYLLSSEESACESLREAASDSVQAFSDFYASLAGFPGSCPEILDSFEVLGDVLEPIAGPGPSWAQLRFNTSETAPGGAGVPRETRYPLGDGTGVGTALLEVGWSDENPYSAMAERGSCGPGGIDSPSVWSDAQTVLVATEGFAEVSAVDDLRLEIDVEDAPVSNSEWNATTFDFELSGSGTVTLSGEFDHCYIESDGPVRLNLFQVP